MSFATDQEAQNFMSWVLGMQKPGEHFTKADVRFFFDLWNRTPELRGAAA